MWPCGAVNADVEDDGDTTYDPFLQTAILCILQLIVQGLRKFYTCHEFILMDKKIYTDNLMKHSHMWKKGGKLSIA